MTTVWLTRAEAAKRVARSERTIARWIEQGHVREMLGRISEPQLLIADREMRERRSHAGERLSARDSFDLSEQLDAASAELLERIRSNDPSGHRRWRGMWTIASGEAYATMTIHLAPPSHVGSE